MVKSYANLLLILTLCLNWLQSNGTVQPLPTVVAHSTVDVHLPIPNDEQEKMEQFFDEEIEEQLASHQIPGATISVVKDGGLFFAKGYGLADVENRIPVDVERTLFRIGSTSKLFTWTAVMQLVEQGKLDLDRDINAYLLDFQIPSTYPEPVTLRHLMTHTSGFEEQFASEIATDPAAMIPLGEHLARYMPARVRPPGELTAYSNYGTALAGYIVSNVSGMTFESYVEENIFHPLGMVRSTFRQPLPSNLDGNLAMGYSISGGSFGPEPFHYVNIVPAGAMSSTALDMAQFMIAHLQDGQYGDTRILQKTTAQQMHQRQFANDPRLNGFALGFFDLNQNQQHILEHGGGMPTFHTLMALLPEQNIGVFISYNSAEGILAVGETFQAFLDHYYPIDNASKPEPLLGFTERATKFTGQYRTTRFIYTKIGRIAHLGGLGFGRVIVNPDGTLSLDFDVPRGQFTGNYIEVAPLLFQEINGPEKLIFKEDSKGNITHLFINSIPHQAFEKIAWYETAWFSQRILFVCLAMFLSVVVAFVGSLVWTRRNPDLFRSVAFGTSILAIVLVFGFLSMLSGYWPADTAPSITRILLGLALSMPILTGVLVILAVRAWLRGHSGLVARIHYSLVAIALIVFIWFLRTWNLLGFHL
ncbi:MAG TPA: serine hydrolase domain-containing protein [Anaerolineales bacterium]|nr:serine hydrolase domain-containing protein [Anaerolineales bacterium]